MRSRLAVAFVVLGILVVGCVAGVRALELQGAVGSRGAALVVVAVAAAVALVGWVLAGLLARPFRQLAVAASDLARGRFDLDLPDSRVPEVRAVADALRRSSERLRRRMVRDQAFLSDASHRLRTPVTGMRLELEDLLLQPGLVGDARGTVERSVRALERLDQTMTGFFAMASAGRREVDDARVPVEEVAASLETRWRARLPRRTTLRVRTEGDAGLLLAPGPVEMVLDPVLDDLCGATPPLVELVLGGGGDQLRVRVWSEGGHTGLDGRERAARPAMVEVRERAEMLGGRCLGDPVDAELRLWLGRV